MINYNQVKKYCCEDPRLIENYEAAVNDKTQTWAIHHRLETDENKSAKQLIDERRYFNVPACELIFLTKSEHIKIHMEGKKHPMYGKSPSEETRKKMSESKLSEKNPMFGKGYKISGEKNYWYGRTGEKTNCFGHCWMTNGIDTIYPKKEDANKYIKLGYHFGRK